MGVAFGIVFLWMSFKGDNPWARLGVCLYLFGMLGSYIASTVYHALPRRSKWKERLRRWDHAAIYWHIAGSYSPLTLVALRNAATHFSLFTLPFSFNWYHHQFHQAERTLQCRDVLFRRHGPQRADSLQAADGHCIYCCRSVAYRRRCSLHHGSRLLHIPQEEIYAQRLPLLPCGMC